MFDLSYNHFDEFVSIDDNIIGPLEPKGDQMIEISHVYHTRVLNEILKLRLYLVLLSEFDAF